MKAAIATPDGDLLWEDHFGQSPYYQICEFDGKQWKKAEMRKNPIAERGEHAHPEEIHHLLSDCAIYAARRMGKKSRSVLNSSGIVTYLKDVSNIDQMIALLPTPDGTDK